MTDQAAVDTATPGNAAPVVELVDADRTVDANPNVDTDPTVHANPDEPNYPASEFASADTSTQFVYIDTTTETSGDVSAVSKSPGEEDDSHNCSTKSVSMDNSADTDSPSESPSSESSLHETDFAKEEKIYAQLRKELSVALPQAYSGRNSMVKSEPISRIEVTPASDTASLKLTGPDQLEPPPAHLTTPIGPGHSGPPNTRVVLISSIPSYWNPQILYDIFAVYCTIQGTYIYDIRNDDGLRNGLVECADFEDAARIIVTSRFQFGQIILSAGPSVINKISDVLREYPRFYFPYGWPFASSYPLYPPVGLSWSSPAPFIPTGPSAHHAYQSFHMLSDSDGHGLGRRIFIKNLNSRAVATENDLKRMFAIYGPVLQTKVCQYEKNPAISFGFVTFANQESARRAVADLDGMFVSGYILQISFAVPRVRS